jgi:hypothetical protein
VKKVKKVVLGIFVTLVAVAVLASSIGGAFATTTNVDYERAGASCIIVVPESNIWVRLAVSGQMHGNYYSGKADRIQIYVRTGGLDTSPTWKSVSAYEDNPTRSAFSAGLGVASEVQNVVKPWQIGVIRICKTVVVYWTIPLECLATGGSSPTPAVTIPPGMLVLQGYGDIISPATVGPVSFGTTGWTIAYTQHYYSATATLFCHDWNYKWKLIDQDLPPSAYSIPRAVVDRVWTWTHA